MSLTTTLPACYVKLLEAFPLRPLRDDADLGRAVQIVSSLARRAVANLEPEELDYLRVLGDLVHTYEAEHDPLPDLQGVEAIRFLMQQNNLNQVELCEQTGIKRTTLSEILAGRRTISAKVRETLAKRFCVSPAMFV